jgi:hypothetical protein
LGVHAFWSVLSLFSEAEIGFSEARFLRDIFCPSVSFPPKITVLFLYFRPKLAARFLPFPPEIPELFLSFSRKFAELF